jgi:hypothetical protein
MKKLTPFILFFIFLCGTAAQYSKSLLYTDAEIENIMDTEEETEKAKEDFKEVFDTQLKLKLNTNTYTIFPNFEFKLKQYIDHIFQYKNPSHEVEINPPEFIA